MRLRSPVFTPVDDVQDVVLEYYAAFDRLDAAALEAMLTEDFKAHMPGKAKPLLRSDFKGFASMFFGAFPDIAHTFEDVLVDGQQVVTRGYFTGTHKGPFQGLPPTGQRVKVDFIHIDRVEDGCLVEHWGQADLAAIFAQLGVTPLPFPAIARALWYRLFGASGTNA